MYTLDRLEYTLDHSQISITSSIRVIGSQGMTDAAEAMALGHNTDGVHIYSCSWGPPDNGYAVEGPGPLLEAVLEKGAREGRGGKGSIYVWATGNGGQHGDSCALDGYISSIYTIGIGGANQNAYPAYYDEQCSSKMAVTFNDNSFSSKSAKDITTLDADGQCIHHFTGTSASCPLASGTFALALQANPTLTWRDLQYLVVYTSNPNPFRPSTTANWKRNGAGLYVNHRFGFGAIDAEALVTRARNWITVPTQHSYTHTAIGTPRIAEFGWPLTKTFRIPGNCGIRFLEHVVLKISLELKGEFDLYSYSNYSETDPPFNHNQAQRGQVSITLTSPRETVSTLLPSREKDFINSEGFDSWPFMSVHHWGEDPKGDWTLKVHYRSSSGCVSVTNATVVLYGTKRRPKAVRGMPRDCDASCARNCSRRGNQFCDACTDLRNSTTLECTNSCASDFNSENGYCIDPLETISYAYTPPAHLLDDATPSSSISSVSVTTTTCLVPSTTVPVTSSVDSVVLSTSDSKQTHITPTSTQAQPHSATVVAPPQPTHTITATPVSSLEAGLDALEESTDFITSLVGSESESPSTSSSPVSSQLSPFLQSSPSRTLAVAPSPTNGPLVSSTSSFPSLHFMVLLLSLLSTLLSFTLS